MIFRRFMTVSALLVGTLFINSSHATGQTHLSDMSGKEQSASSVFALPAEKNVSSAASSGNTISPFTLPPEEIVENSDKSASASKFPVTISEDDASRITAVDLQKKGTALARDGKLEEARELLARSLEKDPENLVTLNNLGLVMRKLGRLNDALQAYQFALKLNDKYALTYKNLGILLEKQGEHKLAVKAYQKYCLLAPDAADIQKVSARASWLNEQE